MESAPYESRSDFRRRRAPGRGGDDRGGPDGEMPTLGRQAPHSVEAEEYLLSCCLLDGSDSIAKCLEKKLAPAAFYVPANRIIFEKLVELYQTNPPVAIEVLAEELKTTGQLDEIGGLPYLMQVSSRIPTTAQTDYFIERVRELHLLRQLIKVGTSTVEQCFNFQGGLEEFVDKIEQDIFQVTQERVSDGAKSMKQTAKDAWVVIDKMMHHKGEITGVSSGYKDLDAMTYGFQKAEMIILAARPSMGKTSLALNMAEHAAMPKRGTPTGTLVFSLEMSAAQLGMRLLCSRGRVNMKKLREGFVSQGGKEYQDLQNAADEMSRAPIFIDDSSHLTIMELRAKARRLHARHPLGFIVVDYLQLLSPTDPKTPREQQVAEISRGLKSLAKELELPVLVLSQLNRSAEKENRTPKLSDLRESGSIEQDADVVLMLARPRDADEKFQVAADSAELIVAKQRNGPVGDLKLTFLRDITRFENYTT
ncbi:replicative DNA helicase [Actomonas aquatica]|uniref:Replicative DNA helicase n=1 Tax=Actomonas aquatica TaxID=2866162 RepID=A0ABZ1C7C6_9BACT|nr:replicative DNA helicase [Opitutus sp. WL0086]WRQ87628.1 replicative DNA helicase [Opitutus sp. WL0086]